MSSLKIVFFSYLQSWSWCLASTFSSAQCPNRKGKERDAIANGNLYWRSALIAAESNGGINETLLVPANKF